MNRLLLMPIRRVLLTTFIICILIALFYVNIASVLGELNGLLDFGSFIAAGQLASKGENPYANNSPLIFSVYFKGIDHFGVAPNLNPPISVLIFQQIAHVPPMVSVQVWRILTVVFYIWAISLLIKRNRGKTRPFFFWMVIWSFGLAGLWHTIQLGQIYTFLLLLVMGIIINMEKKRNILAGIILGLLIAIKPNFIFWAIALGITGYWSIFFPAGITALFISLVPIYFYGIKIYQQWLEATKIFTPDLLIFPGNNSIQGLAAHFNLAQTGTILSAVFFIATLIIIYKYKPSIFNINALSIITSLLISPIAWTGYTILTLPIFFKSPKWRREHWIAAFIFAVPFFFIIDLFQRNFFSFVFWGWFYGWGLLILWISEFVSTIKFNLNTATSTNADTDSIA